MTLQHATVEQLCAWQADIVAELARRAAPSPPVARAPWEMAAPPAAYAPPQPADPRQAEIDRLRAQLAAIAPPAPAMLGGRGMVAPTFKTDPRAAAAFAGVAARTRDDAPPVHGNGIGEGAADIGTR